MSLAKHLRSITDKFHSTRVQRMVPELYDRITAMARDYAALGLDKINFKNDDIRYSDVSEALRVKLEAEGFFVDIKDNFIHVSW